MPPKWPCSDCGELDFIRRGEKCHRCERLGRLEADLAEAVRLLRPLLDGYGLTDKGRESVRAFLNRVEDTP